MQVRWPGVLSGGRRIEGCASLVDLTATILDAAGISTDEQKDQWKVDGDSMLSLLQGQDSDWKDEAFAEHNAHGTDRPRAMIRQGKWKLCYNHGETAVPEGIGTEYARGDYISPLYGPNGEVLTEDYPFDHAHHRAVCWSWATIQWRDEARDMFAVRGARARPTRYVRKEEGPVLGVIEAESEWKWDDETPIVDECAIIRVFRQTGGCRFIDVEVQLRAIVDGLSFAGRLGEGYGGFSVRMAPGEGQQIVLHNDPPDAVTRRSWADYSAEFPGGDGRSGLTIIQYAGNPQYPSGWLKYPPLNFFQPAYPGGSLVPMPKGEVIVLKYRLWVHTGAPGEETLADLWTACNKPPSARVQD